MVQYDLARLTPANYPNVQEIGTRFADLDELGHINNLALGSLFEDSRTRFLISIKSRDLQGLQCQPEIMAGAQLMLVSQRFDYIAQAYYPAPISAYTAIGEIGRSSFLTLQLATQNAQPVGLCTATCVLVADGRSTPLPDALKSRLTPWRYLAPQA